MRGWDASDYLAGRIGPGTEWTHERVSRATGISQTTISNYAGGSKPLGIKNAQKIAAALGLTVGDLGAPVEAVVTVASIDGRLGDLQGAVAELLRSQAASADRERRALRLLAELGTRLQRVEALLEPGAGDSKAAG